METLPLSQGGNNEINPGCLNVIWTFTRNRYLTFSVVCRFKKYSDYAAQRGNQAQTDRRQRSNVQDPGQTSDELVKSVLVVVEQKDKLQLPV